MKRLSVLTLLFILTICFFNSCVDEIVVADKNKTGKIVIESVPVQAEIYLLGTNTNKMTPDSLNDLESGDYQITLKKNGYADSTISVKVYKNLTTTKTIVLRSISSPGVLSIESIPDSALIYLSGVNTRKTTPYSFILSDGLYIVTLKKQSYFDTTFNVTITKNITNSKKIILKNIDSVSVGNVFLESEPIGAQIFLSDSNTQKITPDSILGLKTGVKQFTLKLNGYKDTTFNLTVNKNQFTNKKITLIKETEFGSISLESEPSGASIFLAGVNTNKTTPDSITNLEAGNYQFTLKLNGYNDSTFNISLSKNQQVNKKVTLTKSITTGSVFLDSEPVGAQIFLEGVNTSKTTPDSITDLEEGSHQFTLKFNGYKDTTFNVSIIKNQQINKKITLTKENTTGSVFLESEPKGAKIFLSGSNTNKTTPDSIANLEAGNYQFTLKLNGYRDTTFNLTVIKNQQTNKKITLNKIITTGSVFLESKPNGAQIFLDGSDTQNLTPNTFTDLEEGSHQFTLKLNGYNDTTFNIIVVRNQQVNKTIELTEETKTGSLSLTSQPSGADIFLDDNNTDEETPETFNDLTPGTYSVTLKLKDYEDTTFSAEIKKGELTSKNIILTEKDPVEIDKLSYQYVGFFFINTRFSFSFDQDVKLDKVEVVKKGDSNPQTFQFDETEEIKKDKTTTFDYPGRITGTYVLTFYGKKSKGTKTDFIIEKEIDIP